MIRFYKLGVILGLLTMVGCATGERFGESDPQHTNPQSVDLECENDADCWDADPFTIDVCDEDGNCAYVVVVVDDTDQDTEIPGDECVFQQEIEDDDLGGEGLISALDISQSVSQLVHTAPLSKATMVKLSIRQQPRRVWIRPSIGEIDDVMIVLLRDCANTSFNRIAWGRSIFSEELPKGDYYLALFALGGRKNLDVDAFFLNQTHCDDAAAIYPGVIEDSTAGLADDFDGNCLEPKYADGHRGDKVYTFTVPEDKQWNVAFNLSSQDDNDLAYWMYLKAGCGDPDLADLSCVSASDSVAVALDDEEVLAGENVQSNEERELTLTAQGLKQGTYYLFIDTLVEESFEEEMFELTMEVNPHAFL